MESGLTRRFAFGGQEYAFDLCRKRDLALGPMVVDHWWMPVTPLYGQRRGSSPASHNRSEILRLYWAVVESEQATNVRWAQEKLALASLLPKMRVEGSRTIFADAFLRRGRRTKQKEQIQELEWQLAAGFANQLSADEFDSQSWSFLGRAEFPHGIQEIYDTVARDLLDEPCAYLAAGEVAIGLSVILQKWNRLMRTIGRRVGKIGQKIILDVLSYEARAAFHHCYSVAWLGLIHLLSLEEGSTPSQAEFLRFWHTVEGNSETGKWLFHSHVFGLHPGTGIFMLTKTGPELLGEWLAGEQNDARGRLLNGLNAALVHYSLSRNEARDSPKSAEFTVPDVEVFESIDGEPRVRHPNSGVCPE